MSGNTVKPLLTEFQFIRLCKYLLWFHYGIVVLHFFTAFFYASAFLIGLHSSDASTYFILSLVYTLFKTYLRFRFFSRGAYIGVGTAGEVGLSLPATTNYTFWGLWCMFELMMAFIAFSFVVKALMLV